MNKSESIANLATALCQFQAEISNPKNTANNPFFKSKYAPLNDVLNLVRPILSKHGLSIFQSPSGNGDSIIITTMLMHNSGEWIEADPLVLKADKATAQGAGSAITYGRRYSLSAILGIASEEDDDGNHATGNDRKSEPQQHKSNPTTTNSVSNPVCSDCGNTITAGIKKVSEAKFGKAICMICQKKQQQIGAK